MGALPAEPGIAFRLNMATKPEPTNELKVDPSALYLEEIFTDRRVGTIRRLTPVKKDGQRDAARAVLYIGETQVLTPAGTLPIGFEIGAGSLEEAADKFGQLAREAIERTVKELQALPSVVRVDEGLGRERADAAFGVRAQGACGEEARRDGDAKRAARIARDDRPCHGRRS